MDSKQNGTPLAPLTWYEMRGFHSVETKSWHIRFSRSNLQEEPDFLSEKSHSLRNFLGIRNPQPKCSNDLCGTSTRRWSRLCPLHVETCWVPNKVTISSIGLGRWGYGESQLESRSFRSCCPAVAIGWWVARFLGSATSLHCSNLCFACLPKTLTSRVEKWLTEEIGLTLKSPSEDKDKPSIIHVFNINSIFNQFSAP